MSAWHGTRERSRKATWGVAESLEYHSAVLFLTTAFKWGVQSTHCKERPWCSRYWRKPEDTWLFEGTPSVIFRQSTDWGLTRWRLWFQRGYWSPLSPSWSSTPAPLPGTVDAGFLPTWLYGPRDHISLGKSFCTLKTAECLPTCSPSGVLLWKWPACWVWSCSSPPSRKSSQLLSWAQRLGLVYHSLPSARPHASIR